MHVLAIGASGKVGSLTLPFLAERHSLRVFDLRPPAAPVPAVVTGDVRDYSALREACEGCEALLYMAMGGGAPWGSPESARAHFDVNVTGLHLALRAAHAAGIRHAVVTSSMSVYDRLGTRFIPDEDQPCDASEYYGLSKRLGEEVCRAACREWGLSVTALRLCLPVAAEEWQALAARGEQSIHTEAGDVARALLAALERPFGGFEAFTISGDWREQGMGMRKAKALLGWEPQARLA